MELTSIFNWLAVSDVQYRYDETFDAVFETTVKFWLQVWISLAYNFCVSCSPQAVYRWSECFAQSLFLHSLFSFMIIFRQKKRTFS
jgi:hypothetical protein